MSDGLRAAWARLTAWFGSRRLDREFDEEVAAHVELAAAEERARGASPDEARRRALGRLGGLTQTKEHYREARGLPAVEALGRDLRDAVRLLGRSPSFTTVAVLSLALGIGANAAIFSILNSLVLRPLPVADPGALVQLVSGPQRTDWTNPLWEQIRDRPHLFAGVAAWSATNQANFGLVERGELRPLSTYSVNGAFFDVLGVRPSRGRLLTPADDIRTGPGETVVAVISDAFWASRFGRAEDVIGQVIPLTRFPVTIVGVTAPGFFGPEVGRSFDLILPLGSLPRPLLDARGFWWISLLARLKEGQSAEDASRALRAIQPELRQATLPGRLRPEQAAQYLAEPLAARPAASGPSSLRARYRDPLLVVMATVGLVLLIACANIANLLLARADARTHEFAVRKALGASRPQLVRQLLIESLLLAGLGATAGGVLAVWAGHLLVSQLASSVTLPLPFDGRVLMFTALVTAGTALLFGIGPALRATRAAPGQALSDRSRPVAGSGSSSRLGRGLVVAQISLSFVLVVGAGLLLRTFASLVNAPLGFDPAPVLAVALTTRPGMSLGAEPQPAARYAAVLDAVRSLRGVEAASFSGATSPMSGFQHGNVLENPPGLALSEASRDTFFRDAGIGWFDTFSMRIVAGRDFDARDLPVFQSVAVVNETLARRFFPGANPIGQTVREVAPAGQTVAPITIVGVVGDAVYNSVREGVPPTLFRLVPRGYLVVRVTGGDPARLSRDITETIARTDPALLGTVQPLSALVRATVARERLVAMMSGLFGAIALLLAGVGVYGVMAYNVGQRRREIALRRALGADTRSITNLVVGRSLTLVAGGVAIGVLTSVWLMGWLAPLLFGLGPRDPSTIAGAAAILGAIGLVAGWLPARRATKVDPAAVLREG